ncbi:hypothetical protein NPIL_554351 [Nephila pilipes]|uniref:Uncharacterized protein n=1 Tax=Nephila pilipes TaxID=299642 RepID=A0A8X6U4S6_NEPPI|nr:hypothetical protein NPIL_554351 [Nephila pilipes]
MASSRACELRRDFDMFDAHRLDTDAMPVACVAIACRRCVVRCGDSIHVRGACVCCSFSFRMRVASVLFCGVATDACGGFDIAVRHRVAIAMPCGSRLLCRASSSRASACFMATACVRFDA